VSKLDQEVLLCLEYFKATAKFNDCFNFQINHAELPMQIPVLSSIHIESVYEL